MLRDIGIAVCRFKDYPDFLNNRKRRVIGFGFFIALLCFLLTAVVPVLRFHISTGGISRLMEDYIPDFELTEGRLWVEEPVEFDADGMLIVIDTSPDFFFEKAGGLEKQLSSWNQAILMDSEKMIVKNGSDLTEISFNACDFQLTRESAAAYLVQFAFIGGSALLLLGYIVLTLAFFLGALITALLGMIVASCTRTRVSFGQIYILAVYSRALPLLIKALLSLFSIRIPFFTVLNYGLSVFILYLAFGTVKNRAGMMNPE